MVLAPGLGMEDERAHRMERHLSVRRLSGRGCDHGFDLGLEVLRCCGMEQFRHRAAFALAFPFWRSRRFSSALVSEGRSSEVDDVVVDFASRRFWRFWPASSGNACCR